MPLPRLMTSKIAFVAIALLGLGTLGVAAATTTAASAPATASAAPTVAAATATPTMELSSATAASVPTAIPTADPTLSTTASPTIALPDGTTPPVGGPTPPPATYGGRYSFAIPAIGVGGSIRDMNQCGGLLGDGGIWAWPCGGQNNLVLLAHGWGAFAPIYHGYHSGALHTGLSATYIDSTGKSHAYFVAQVNSYPVAYALSGWAFVDEQTPVITLVTCDDPNDSRRIIVRLIPVGSTNPDPTFPLTPISAPTPTLSDSASPSPSATPVPNPVTTPVPTPDPTPVPTPDPTPAPDPTPTPDPTTVTS